jgi:hypothetical protein
MLNLRVLGERLRRRQIADTTDRNYSVDAVSGLRAAAVTEGHDLVSGPGAEVPMTSRSPSATPSTTKNRHTDLQPIIRARSWPGRW